MKRTITITGDIDEIFDGYNSNIELYTHRYVLVIALMKSHPQLCWKAKKDSTGAEKDGVFYCGITIPEFGDIAYEMPLEQFWNNLSEIYEREVAVDNMEAYSSEHIIITLSKWIGL